jgi:DNA-binding response OmpR family regulator
LAKLLVVDDDKSLAEELVEWFELENHRCEVVHSGKDALQILTQFQFEVVILDWNLPDLTGLAVCQEYRKAGGQARVLFLTGQGDVESKQAGLDSGGDDYLQKPFDVRELTARVRSLLRRSTNILPTKLELNGVHLELDSKEIHYGELKVGLRRKHCQLLEFLMRNPNKAFSARALLNAVWSSNSDSGEEAVRTQMRFLRQRLATIGLDDFVSTIAGSGYTVRSEASE